ncbi:hypothetical protein MRX96_058794 [Rhipicephalus microplus]
MPLPRQRGCPCGGDWPRWCLGFRHGRLSRNCSEDARAHRNAACQPCEDVALYRVASALGRAPWASPGCREARTMTLSGNGAENALGTHVISCYTGWSLGGGLAGEKPLRAGLFSRRGAIVVCGE